MRPRPERLLFVLGLACLQGGCGTFLNLTAPPTSPQLICGPAPPSSCVPLGGTFRSAMCGGYYLIVGMGAAVEEFGHGGLLKGAGMTGVGLAALVVDTPLSFLGDLATLPIASARQQGEPWATWWGQQAALKREAVPLSSPPPPATLDGPVTQATAREAGAAGSGQSPEATPAPWPH